MNPTLMIATMIAINTEEEEIINNCLEDLNEHKENFKKWIDSGKEGETPQLNIHNLAMLMLKSETRGMTSDQALKFAINKGQTIDNVNDMEQMMKDNNIEPSI
jgi:hypothetical protein